MTVAVNADRPAAVDPRRRAGPSAGRPGQAGAAVGDRSLLAIALDAAGDCPIVVVGPPRDLPAGVLATTGGPTRRWPGGGVAAGVAALPPLLPGRWSPSSPPTCRRRPAHPATGSLLPSTAATDDPAGDGSADGAVLVDAARAAAIPDRRLADPTGWPRRSSLRPHWHGAPLHALLSPLTALEIPGHDRETDDVDTPDDWRRWQS